jgi:serine/threonine kinase PknH
VDEVMFGRYRLFEVIGQGGMGTVYRAHDTEIGRDVAIKVLPPELATEPGYQERFRREAHTAARLAEPHVIPIYDTGEIDGRLYLVMPIIDGVDLESVLTTNGPMTPSRAVEVIEQLATALQTAHNAGLVHRDVKPSNALITANEFVYLIDFGIAHDASATKLTRTGSIVGTWAYMAPERFGSGTADARADVYALACVLYECLTGQLPYPGNSLEPLVAGHLTGPVPRPTVLNPALPAGFDHVIARGMAKDPQQRYQTATQLATAARQALTGTLPAEPWPTPTPQPSTQVPTTAGWPPPPRRSRRRWIIAGAAVAAAVITAAVLIAALGTGPKPTPTAHTPSKSPTPTTPPTPMVTPDRLDSILLTPQDVNAIMGATGMQSEQGIRHGIFVSNFAQLSNPACLPSLYIDQGPVYRGSGYTAVSYDELSEPGNNYTHIVEEAALTFPSADQAVGLVKSAAAKIGACAGQSITQSQGGASIRWTIGNLVGDVPTVTQVNAQQGNSFTCQRAMSAVLNVVVDVDACAAQVSTQGRQIADKMTANATR